MMTKTGSWLVASTLAVTSLWAAPAKADDAWGYCSAEYALCMEQASGEPVDWIRDIKEADCQSYFNMCLGTYHCGDNVCDDTVGEGYYCPSDCD